MGSRSPLEDAALRAYIEGSIAAVVTKAVESVVEMLVELTNEAANNGAHPQFIAGISFAAEATRRAVQSL